MKNSIVQQIRKFEFIIGGIELLPQLEQISSAFQANTIFEIQPLQNGLGGLALVEKHVDPFIKDYDSLPDGKPTEWCNQFDMRNWGMVLAMHQKKPVAGAAIAIDTPGVNMLAGRQDLAVLWDIRVSPSWRGLGIGKTIFLHAVAWAREHGCVEMKIETQNVNVAACHFYSRRGCILGEIDTRAYETSPGVENEAMIIWYLPL